MKKLMGLKLDLMEMERVAGGAMGTGPIGYPYAQKTGPLGTGPLKETGPIGYPY